MRHYYPPATNAASIALNASRDFLCSIHADANIRVTHRNGAIKHIFYESDPRRDHQRIVLYSFCRSNALALHLAVKIFFKIFLYEDLSTLALHTSEISLLISLRMPAGPHFVTQPILLIQLIPNI